MHVTFDGNIICDGDNDGPINLAIESQRVAEVAQLVRATEVSVFDRGNRQTSVSFERAFEATTHNEAEDKILQEAAELPNQGDLVITSQDDVVYTLSNAALMRHSSRVNGVTARITYQFVGGQITK